MPTFYLLTSTIAEDDKKIKVEKLWGKSKGNQKQRALSYYCRSIYRALNSEVELTTEFVEKQIQLLQDMLKELENEKLLKDDVKSALITHCDEVVCELKKEAEELQNKKDAAISVATTASEDIEDIENKNVGHSD